jgi:hypothetical protein
MQHETQEQESPGKCVVKNTNTDGHVAKKNTRGEGKRTRYPTYCFPCEKLIKNRYALYEHKRFCKNTKYKVTQNDLAKLQEIQLCFLTR